MLDFKLTKYQKEEQKIIIEYYKEYNKKTNKLPSENLFQLIIDYNISLKTINKFINEEQSLNENIDIKIENIKDNSYVDYQNVLLLNLEEHEELILICIYRIIKMEHYKKNKFVNSDEYAKSSLEVYAPLAHRFGLYKLKTQLEELSLYYLDYENFFTIVQGLKHKKSERDSHVNMMIEKINHLTNSLSSEVEIFGRSKSIYSIYKKMHDKNKDISDLFDLHAIRIICTDIVECYTLLGMVHSEFDPIEGRFKDYIAFKKSNLYQSLHTAVYNDVGVLFEIQIRTKEMDEIAEKGIAAHWIYKQGDSKQKSKPSITGDETMIYTYSPNRKIIWLSKNASVIDFAYEIHTKIAEQMVGAKVNAKMVAYSERLKTGDIIEIITKNNFIAPNEQWLQYAVTSKAQKRIKSFIKQQNYLKQKEQISLGEDVFNQFLKTNKIEYNMLLPENTNKIARNFSCNRIADFYLRLSNKQITFADLRDFFKEKQDEIKLVDIKSIAKEEAVIVEGATNIAKKIANCCLPVKGDQIVGVISTGVSIKIHRDDCKNLRKSNFNKINVNWNYTNADKILYKSLLKIVSSNNVKKDVLNVMTKMKCPVSQISSKQLKDNYITTVTIAVENIETLGKIKAKMLDHRHIIDVERKFN